MLPGGLGVDYNRVMARVMFSTKSGSTWLVSLRVSSAAPRGLRSVAAFVIYDMLHRAAAHRSVQFHYGCASVGVARRPARLAGLGWVMLVAGMVAVCVCPAFAQGTGEPGPTPGERPAVSRPAGTLAERALEAFRRGEYKLSRELLEKQAVLEPENFVPRYNLACCHAKMNDKDAAIKWLAEAIEKGFCDGYLLRRDEAFDGLANDARFKAIIASWQEVLAAQRDANLAQVKLLFKDGPYTEFTDETLRLVYWSAFDARSGEQARGEVARVAAFGQRHVFGGGDEPRGAGGMGKPSGDGAELAVSARQTLPPLAKVDDAWVVVVLPTRKDYVRWATRTYGIEVVNGMGSSIGGAYEHDAKRLVSMDLGSTLRHEFFHVLHWRDNTQRGQSHPIWIQEGLSSLMEDYNIAADGECTPAPSWRTNIAKRLEALRRLMTIDKLVAMPPHRFSGQRPLANYAMARSLLMFIDSRGKLKEWYAHYTDHYEQDRTGLASLTAVLGIEAASIDNEFRAWLKETPAVRESLRRGDPSLGIEVEAGAGEGPVVSEVARSNKSGLRRGDIITGVAGRATRDVAELVRVLTSLEVGEKVEVEYRRSRLVGLVDVTLTARK